MKTLEFDPRDAGLHCAQLVKTGAISLPQSNNLAMSWDSAEMANGISVAGVNITFSKAGKYKVALSFRSVSDVWTRFFMRDGANVIYGKGVWSGGNVSPAHHHFFVTIPAPGVFVIAAHIDSASSVANPAPSLARLAGNEVLWSMVADIIEISGALA